MSLSNCPLLTCGDIDLVTCSSHCTPTAYPVRSLCQALLSATDGVKVPTLVGIRGTEKHQNEIH